MDLSSPVAHRGRSLALGAVLVPIRVDFTLPLWEASCTQQYQLSSHVPTGAS